jgi:hypothetical protein
MEKKSGGGRRSAGPRANFRGPIRIEDDIKPLSQKMPERFLFTSCGWITRLHGTRKSNSNRRLDRFHRLLKQKIETLLELICVICEICG